jgi:Ankyrin repeat
MEMQKQKQQQKQNLLDALFEESSVLWDGIMNGDPQVLSDLIAHENQKTGPKNLLSNALYLGFYMNCCGDQVYHLLDRISFIAQHIVSRVNEPDDGFYTPLMRAVQWGHLEVIQTLLSRVPHDVDIDASSEDDSRGAVAGEISTVTAAELAMVVTATPQWNQLNQHSY